MKLNILQLNINADNFWAELTAHISQNDYDVLLLQELAGKDTVCGNLQSTRDCFAELQIALADRYTGELAIAQRYTCSPTAYLGVATFYKKQFTVLSRHILPLYERDTPFPAGQGNFEESGRNLLHLKLEINGQPVSFLNTHFAWAPTPVERPHQLLQGNKLVAYLERIGPEVFVLTGDFNINTKQPTIRNISKLARNLTDSYGVANTINFRTHTKKITQQTAVDYIFTDPAIIVENFEVLEREDLSDHLALRATITL
jgi:endonuclease/exonuclease/phosphatase family metal-dependent hydrolase